MVPHFLVPRICKRFAAFNCKKHKSKERAKRDNDERGQNDAIQGARTPNKDKKAPRRTVLNAARILALADTAAEGAAGAVDG